MSYFVYELINLLGTVEYVGETRDPKRRFRQHVGSKPGIGTGKFYKRQDLFMNIVSEYATKKEAFDKQCELQTSYGLKTDKSIFLKGPGVQRKLTMEQADQIKKMYAAKEYSHRGLASQFNVAKYTIQGILDNKNYNYEF
jgi:predicted GIY-YIG superfamily endonuclease